MRPAVYEALCFRAHQIGADPEKSSLASLGGPDSRKLSELCASYVLKVPARIGCTRRASYSVNGRL